ncbi:MAG: hypothetical protein E7354_00885 [Clostridiales bacterium]|nr:hypothetical protein [Clostridiales bacterium]
MKIEDVKSRIRCEMPNCKNIADIKIHKDGFVRSAGLFLCNDCMKSMYEELGKRIVPKSPISVFNKKSKSGVKSDV